MPGTGYNIPISLSAASTFSVPQTQNAPSYVVYGSNSRVGGDTQQNPSNINPATATSAAAEGDALASSAGSGVTTPGALSSLSTVQIAIIAAGAIAVVGIIAFAVIYKRK